MKAHNRILGTCTALAILFGTAIPVRADSIAVYYVLTPIEASCGYSFSNSTLYLDKDFIDEDCTITIEMQIETEEDMYRYLRFLYATFVSDSEWVTLNSSSIVSPILAYSSEELTYTLSDGTEFTSKYLPYCMGYVKTVGSLFIYERNCFSWIVSDDSNGFHLTWMGNSVADSYVDSTRNYSFTSFTITISADIEVGEYHITMPIGTDDNEQPMNSVSFKEDSIYDDVIPTAKGLTIVIRSTDDYLLGDVDQNGEINAKDAADILVYAAQHGTGDTSYTFTDGSDATLEEKVKTLCADVNDDGEINALDAALVLQYTAILGSQGTADWSEVLGTQ